MRDHPISRDEKLSKKAIFFTGGKNVSFLEYFSYVLYERSLRRNENN